jgi:hypothetical protein
VSLLEASAAIRFVKKKFGPVVFNKKNGPPSVFSAFFLEKIYLGRGPAGHHISITMLARFNLKRALVHFRIRLNWRLLFLKMVALSHHGFFPPTF